MARSVQGVGTLVRSYLTVYDSNNNPVLGLVNSDFTKFLTLDGAPAPNVVTVTEIGNGKYMATFTPTSTGTWDLLIRNAANNPRGWQETYDVTTDGLYQLVQIANAILDQTNGVEVGFNVRQTLRLMSAALCGKVSGGPNSPVFRNMPDSLDRISATCDSQGNRTTVTLTP